MAFRGKTCKVTEGIEIKENNLFPPFIQLLTPKQFYPPHPSRKLRCPPEEWMYITTQKKVSSALLILIFVMFWKVSLYQSKFSVFLHTTISPLSCPSVPNPLMKETVFVPLDWGYSLAEILGKFNPFKVQRINLTVGLLVNVNIWKTIYS